MTQMGTYAELLSTSVSFSQLLEDINQHKQEQDQQSGILTRQITRAGSVIGEIEDDEEINSLPTNIETKKEGTVKWHVYISYLRAGVGVFIGFLIILIIFSAQQATALYNNWWLAEWSNDETQRYRSYNNCISIIDQKTNRIRLMSDTEWNQHRNRGFYTYCG
jgi:hypothetical protein